MQNHIFAYKSLIQAQLWHARDISLIGNIVVSHFTIIILHEIQSYWLAYLWYDKALCSSLASYGTQTSGLILISMTHSHKCKYMYMYAGSAGKGTGPGVQCQNGPQLKYGGQNYITTHLQTRCTLQNSGNVRYRAVASEIVRNTSQRLHTIWHSLTCPHRDWLCGGVWMVWANKIQAFLYRVAQKKLERHTSSNNCK